MIIKVLVSAWLFASLFFVVAPPAFLGSNARKKAIAAALVACVTLVVVRDTAEPKQDAIVTPAATKSVQAERKVSPTSPVPSPEPAPVLKPSRVTDLKSGLVEGRSVEVEVVSATNLFREYERNEVATDMRLKGKIIHISGKVKSVNKDFMDHAYVTLQTPNDFMSASIRPVASDLEKVSRMRKGQLAVFRCEHMARFMGTPSGRNCVVID